MTTTPVELRKYLHDQLAPFKVPRRIVIRDHLPKGTTGKVLRRLLSNSFDGTATEEKPVAAQHLGDSAEVDNTIVIQLTELWQRLLQIAPIALDDDFSEKGGDSLLAMEMLSELERMIGKTIPSAILFEASTIRQLAKKLAEIDNLRRRSIIQINTSGTLPPLFFFHGDFIGGGLYTTKLASLMGSDQPLFVVAPPGFDHEPIPRSIETMAADRLPLIRSLQPRGPYYLCGYCNGGIVAFEVARMLVAAGERVELVGMIDQPSVSARRSFQLFVSAMRHLQSVGGPLVDGIVIWTWDKLEGLEKTSHLPLKERLALIAGKRWNRMKDKVRTKLFVGNRDQAVMENSAAFSSRIGPRDIVIAMTTYSPKPVPVRVIQFSAQYHSMAWRRLCSSFEAIKMAGGHSDVVLDPANLVTIVNRLQILVRTSAP